MSKDIDLIDESNQHWTHTHRYSKCREELALITTERDARQAEIAELIEALDALLHTPAGHSTERNIAIAQAENTLAKVRKP